jgi:hypothetical protein
MYISQVAPLLSTKILYVFPVCPMSATYLAQLYSLIYSPELY